MVSQEPKQEKQPDETVVIQPMDHIKITAKDSQSNTKEILNKRG